MKVLIQESEKAIIYKFGHSHYEVWIKIVATVGPNKGQLLEPKPEDFGVWCWCFYTLTKAVKIMNEIDAGIRTITPMTEAD